MKIATWNVNSIRVRVERALAFLERQKPDVVCMQETKVVDDAFPAEQFKDAGYHSASFGQKTYNGVAILSRTRPEDLQRGIADDAEDSQSRVIAATIDGVRIINVYVPNGSSVGSEKFAYKLHWLQRLHRYVIQESRQHADFLICGDFNIAPDDRDVYDPELWRGRVLFHPKEHKALATLMKDGGLVDAFRLHQEDGGHYTWWDFRGGMFFKDKGLRIDHFLISESLVPRCREVSIDRRERSGKQPSDHAPLLALFDDE